MFQLELLLEKINKKSLDRVEAFFVEMRSYLNENIVSSR